MLTVRITPRAARQIEEAAAWWQLNRPAAPGAIRLDLRVALAVLAEQPGIGSLVVNTRDPTTRRFYLPRTRYFIYYRPRGDQLDVIAFWHASRGQGPRIA